MSQPAIELSETELAIIKERRAQEEAIAAKKERIQLQEYTKAKKRALDYSATVIALAKKLEKSDTDNVFTITYGTREVKHNLGDYDVETAKISFSWGNGTDTVEISEHRVYHGCGYFGRGTNNGMKYHLKGNITDYKSRWYKNPNSLIKAVVKEKDALQAKCERDVKKLNLTERAIAELTAKHPHATIVHEAAYSFGQGRRHQARPDRIIVNTDNGSITYTYYDKDEGITYSVYKRALGKSIADQVNALILGE